MREFNINPTETKKLLEVGCGVGNFLFPLLTELPNLFIYACDFSSTAIDLLRQNPQYDQQRIESFVCDLTEEKELAIEEDSIDFCSMIFVLSAIHPEKMSDVLKKIHRVKDLRKAKKFEILFMNLTGFEVEWFSTLS